MIETLGRAWAYTVFSVVAAMLLLALAVTLIKGLRIHEFDLEERSDVGH